MRSGASLRFVLAVLASLSSPAWADAPSTEEAARGGTKSTTRPVFAALRAPASLEASTDGSANLSAGLGYGVGIAESVDLLAVLSAQVMTSDGAAKLLSVADQQVAGPPAWSVSLTLPLVGLARLDDADRSADRQAQYDAAKACGLAPEIPEYENLCTEGKWILDNLPSLRAAPLFALKPGVRFGTQDFTYRIDAAGDDILVEQSTTRTSWAAGISAFRGIGHRAYIEGLVSVEKSNKASTKKLKWCEAVGGVPTFGDTPRQAEAETCSEGVLGGPSSPRELKFSLGAGVNDFRADVWRAGIRANLVIPFGDDRKDDFSIGFGLPAYFKFATLYPALKYKGLLSLSPEVTAEVPRGSDPVVKVSITLKVLGQRDLFAIEFDKL